MRHAKRNQRLSRPSDGRQALLNSLVKALVRHERIQTTHARAKETQRLADRLVTLGKEGSVHARRSAFRILQDRTLVKRLFAEIAPRFGDVSGGYTRVVRLAFRRGDGAMQALLAFSRLPALQPAAGAGPRPAQAPKKRPAPSPTEAEETPPSHRPKSLFEGLRALWRRKK